MSSLVRLTEPNGATVFIRPDSVDGVWSSGSPGYSVVSHGKHLSVVLGNTEEVYSKLFPGPPKGDSDVSELALEDLDAQHGNVLGLEDGDAELGEMDIIAFAGNPEETKRFWNERAGELSGRKTCGPRGCFIHGAAPQDQDDKEDL